MSEFHGKIEGIVEIGSVGVARKVVALSYVPKDTGNLDDQGDPILARRVVGETVSAADGTYTMLTPNFTDDCIVVALDEYGDAWEADRVYQAGERVRPTIGNENGLSYEVITAGTAGPAEPNWSTPAGSITADGSAVLEAKTAWWPVAHCPIKPEYVAGAAGLLPGIPDPYFVTGLDIGLFDNVDLAGIQNGQILVWSTAAGGLVPSDPPQGGGGSGSGGSTEAEVTQTGHGFAVLTPIYHDGTQWQAARANSGLTTAQAIVVEVTDADNFKLALTGRYTVTAHGLNVNSYYFVSDVAAGSLTTSEPLISQPIVFVEDANTIVAHGYRPQMAAGDAGETIATVKVPVPISFVAGEYTIDLANHQDGERFVVEGGLKSDASGVEAYALLEVNGDTNQSNYRRQNLLAASGAGNDSQGADNYIATLPGSASPVDSEAQYRLTIEAYSDTGYTRALGSWITLESATVLSNGSYAVAHKVASAVTQIKIKSDSGASLSGTLHAYIEKQIVIPNWYDVQVAEIELPVVQSIKVLDDGSKAWESESGWAVSKVGTGKYDITFPSAADSADAQAVVAQWNYHASSGGEFMANVISLTATGCSVTISDDTGTEVDLGFSLVRRLPNQAASQQIAVGAAANPNLLINSNKKINQRGVDRASASDGQYWADRWYRVDVNTDRQYVEYEGPASHVTLSWEGGGTGSINGKTGTSPLTAWIPADTQVEVELPDGWSYSKLETGLVATPWCLAGMTKAGELAACQRYYCKSYDLADAPGTVTNNGSVNWRKNSSSSSIADWYVSFPERMREAPAFTGYSPVTGASGSIRNVADSADRAVVAHFPGEAGTSVRFSSGQGSNEEMLAHYTADAEIYP